jgi:hypothetical protein
VEVYLHVLHDSKGSLTRPTYSTPVPHLGLFRPALLGEFSTGALGNSRPALRAGEVRVVAESGWLALMAPAQTGDPIRNLTSSLPRSVFIMMQPRSAISTSFGSRSRSGPSALMNNSRASNRAGESAIVPITSVWMSESFDSLARMAARRLLMKQPPTAARNSSPPIGPMSVPPFEAGLSTTTWCAPIVASVVEADN